MIRMKDIAKAAGVSRTTVSFVLSDGPKTDLISPATREKVLAAAKKLGYRPNLLARSVATGKTRVVGLIADLPNSHFMGQMLGGLIQGMEASGYLIKFIGRHSSIGERHYIDIALEHRLAGVITINYEDSRIAALHGQLRHHSIPYCVLANSFPVDSGIRVISDDIQGGALAVDCLADQGHSKIAFFGKNPSLGTSALREEGYLAAMERHGLAPLVAPGDCSSPDDICSFLSAHPDWTAAFATNPPLAANIIKAVRLRALEVPQDFSVIGYAETELTANFDPPITTISQHHPLMGETAATALIQAIESGDKEMFERPVTHLIPVDLVPGGSVTRRS